MIARLLTMTAVIALGSACSTTQWSSPTGRAALTASAQCIASIVDLYQMTTQIRATLAEQQAAHIRDGKAP